jgi:hypothetical protein
MKSSKKKYKPQNSQRTIEKPDFQTLRKELEKAICFQRIQFNSHGKNQKKIKILKIVFKFFYETKHEEERDIRF